jgi:hypothetical protein
MIVIAGPDPEMALANGHRALTASRSSPRRGFCAPMGRNRCWAQARTVRRRQASEGDGEGEPGARGCTRIHAHPIPRRGAHLDQDDRKVAVALVRSDLPRS